MMRTRSTTSHMSEVASTRGPLSVRGYVRRAFSHPTRRSAPPFGGLPSRPMDFFDALAVFGALGACAGVYSVWRDRSRLVVDWGTTTSVNGPPGVWLTILNDGRQPVTIRDAGFYGSELPIELQ